MFTAIADRLSVAPLLATSIALGLSMAAIDGPALTEEVSWLGCWQTADAGQTIMFEKDRCAWLRNGKPSFYRTEYSAEGARIETWARITDLKLRMDGEALFMDGPRGQVELERTSKVPSKLRVEPYELPADIEVDEGLAAAVLEDLRERSREDQRVRSGGRTSVDAGEMMRVDADNTEFLLIMIEEIGWIDATRFGSEASDAAFLLVQHSGDIRLMRTALPLVEADVEAGKLNGQAFALLHDRCQLNLGYRQRYGSQIGIMPDGRSVLMPMEDPDGVDARRAALGMGPLAEYLAHFTGDDGVPVMSLEEALASDRASD